MPSRALDISAFLDPTGWEDAEIQPLAADFSTRRYARLVKRSGESAFLMDADPDQKTTLFIEISGILCSLGVKAPRIFAADPDNGLALMEDFGSRNIGGLIDNGSESLPFLIRAVEVVARIHKAFDRRQAQGLNLPIFDSRLFTEQAGLFLDAFFPYAKGHDASEEDRADFNAAWMAVLRPIDNLPNSLMLRDFMPDNLMDIDNHDIGVLDFQDAGIGPIAYDIASLCEEVRRDGGFSALPSVIAHYKNVSGTSVSEPDLTNACIVLSAQRHTRVMGIVVKLATQTGRKDKLAYLPRITRHMNNLLKEQSLIPVREWMRANSFDEIAS